MQHGNLARLLTGLSDPSLTADLHATVLATARAMDEMNRLGSGRVKAHSVQAEFEKSAASWHGGQGTGGRDPKTVGIHKRGVGGCTSVFPRFRGVCVPRTRLVLCGAQPAIVYLRRNGRRFTRPFTTLRGWIPLSAPKSAIRWRFGAWGRREFLPRQIWPGSPCKSSVRADVTLHMDAR